MYILKCYFYAVIFNLIYFVQIGITSLNRGYKIYIYIHHHFNKIKMTIVI